MDSIYLLPSLGVFVNPNLFPWRPMYEIWRNIKDRIVRRFSVQRPGHFKMDEAVRKKVPNQWEWPIEETR
jgi:hypothetical protein